MSNPWANKIVAHADVDPRTLAPHALNWRKHPQAQRDALAGAIAEVGYIRSVTVNKNTGHIIDGHLRVEAAIQSGQPTIPVEYVDLTEDEECEALATIDPLAAMAEADSERLDALLREVSSADAAVMQMLADLAEESGIVPEVEPGGGGDEFDTTPEESGPTRCQPGDLWVIGGKHRLIVGDCTDPAVVERLMGGEKAGCVVTDPPYGVSVVKNNMVGADFGIAKKGKYAPIEGDEAIPDVRFLLALAPQIVMWGGNYFADQLPPTGSWLVWDKRGDSGIENTFADCELAWTNLGCPARVHHQLWNGMIREGEHSKREHPTQKPLALLCWCIGKTAGNVLDPFLGSGTTLIAAHRTGRRCFGCEISPRYGDVILRRAEAEGLTCEHLIPEG